MKISLLLLACTVFAFIIPILPAHAGLDESALEARRILEELVAADTTNPPGNEARAAQIGAAYLKKAGIPFELVEFAPGRQDLVARLIGDPQITIDYEKDFGQAAASPLEGPGPKAIAQVAQKLWPGALIIPSLSLGATDSRTLRAAGVAAYGANPIAASEEDDRRAHGIDERIPAAGIRLGVDYLHRLILRLSDGKKP